MKFKGKAGVWYWLMLAAMNIVMFYCLFTSTGTDLVIISITFLVVDIICVPLVIKNYVEIDGGRLIAVLGFCRSVVEIDEITEVYRTHNPIAAGALSLDRIMIKGKKQSLMISIHEKEKFFAELKRLNPAIRIRQAEFISAPDESVGQTRR